MKTTRAFRVVLTLLIVPLAIACSRNSQPQEEAREPQPRNEQQLSVKKGSLTDHLEDRGALQPFVLDDSAEMEAYVSAFPTNEYEVFSTSSGDFYVDDQEDEIKRYIVRGISWEEGNTQLLQEHITPGSTVLDVGAHIGTLTTILARATGEYGQVFAFEPQKKLYRELRKNLELNKLGNAMALRYALGDGEARVIQMNSAVEGNEGATGIGEGGDKAELRTLDSFGFKNVSLIKIDVEHFENYVLDGAKETIAANKPVLFVEILGGVNYDAANAAQRARIDVTKDKIEAMGYSVEKVSFHDYLAIPLPRQVGR